MLLCSLLSPRASCCYIKYSVVTAYICCYNVYDVAVCSLLLTRVCLLCYVSCCYPMFVAVIFGLSWYVYMLYLGMCARVWSLIVLIQLYWVYHWLYGVYQVRLLYTYEILYLPWQNIFVSPDWCWSLIFIHSYPISLPSIMYFSLVWARLTLVKWD